MLGCKRSVSHLHVRLSLSPSLPLVLTHTGMHTSSIKALHSLLRLLIRKLSLGFRALAYRHLYQAFSEMCSKHGPAIYIEFTGSEGGEEGGGGGRWEVAVVLEATSANKYLSGNPSVQKQVDLNSSEIKASSVVKTWPAAALL